MSTIANCSGKTLRFFLFTGTILLMGWSLLSASSTERDSLRQDKTATQGKQPHHRPKWLQFGKASWYGGTFQGQPTASGEAFDMYQMTCAHRSLPLGALIRVTNLRNHRSVIVRVNDRGPEVENRIVDLSYGAAQILHFQGMARVRLDLIDPAPSRKEVSRLRLPVQPGD